MADFRLSVRASADLLAIYEYTEATFGRSQAERYHAGFENAFGLIARTPRMGTTADEIAPGFRRFRRGMHIIFYTIEPELVLIRAIVHGGQDIRPALVE